MTIYQTSTLLLLHLKIIFLSPNIFLLSPPSFPYQPTFRSGLTPHQKAKWHIEKLAGGDRLSRPFRQYKSEIWDFPPRKKHQDEWLWSNLWWNRQRKVNFVNSLSELILLKIPRRYGSLKLWSSWQLHVQRAKEAVINGTLKVEGESFNTVLWLRVDFSFRDRARERKLKIIFMVLLMKSNE